MEDASAAGNSFASDSPASDADPYASTPSPQPGTASGSTTGHLVWDPTQTPKGLPILGPLFGFTQQRLLNTIRLDAGRCMSLVGRPLTQREFDAISFYCAKMNAISSYGGPVGVLGGIWRAQNSKHTFRFPFWQPDFKPGEPIGEGMFDPKKFGPLKGVQAEAAWHALRRTAYALIGGSVGLAVFGAYATSVAIAGQRMDERMKDIMSALQSMTPEERRAKTSRAAPMPGTELGVSNDQSSSPYSRDIGGADQQRQPQFAQDEQQTSQPPQQYQPPRRQRQSQGVDFDFDDASPQRGMSSSQASSDPWETLRQNARNGVRYSSPANGPSNAWAGKRAGQGDGDGSQGREQGQTSTTGDSFSFSKSDEERQLPREEAQREFDARIDRERKGQDFNGSQKRW